MLSVFTSPLPNIIIKGWEETSERRQYVCDLGGNDFIFIPKSIELYILNMYSFLHANHNSID